MAKLPLGFRGFDCHHAGQKAVEKRLFGEKYLYPGELIGEEGGKLVEIDPARRMQMV